MAQTIKLKRSNTAGNLPTTSDLALGEVAINTKDGKFFLRKHVDGTDSGDAITAYAPQGLNVYGTQTFEVKVITKTASHPQFGTGSANGYSIDGLESPFIVLVPGNTYKFDQSDSSNTGHPLAFYLEEDKTTSYSTGVTTNGTPGSSGAYTQIVASTSTPQVLYYQCSSHAYMGSGSYTLSDAIADGKVGTAQLAANAVTSAKIAANSVDSSELVTGSIDTIHIGDSQVTGTKIADNTIATGNIADNAVDATKIASNSILTRHIDDDQIGIDQLNVTDGTSGQALTTDGAGTLSFSTVASSLSGASDTDITSPSSGQILVHDGTDSFDNVSISGDATLASDGTLTIATNAIESTMIAQNSILTKHIDDNQIGIDQLNVTDGTSGQVLTTDGAGSLSFSTVSGGSGSQNLFSTVAVSGQSDIVADSTTDTLTVAAGSGISLTTDASTDTLTITATGSGLSANAVTSAYLASNAVLSRHIATDAVGSSELAATGVTAGTYGSSTATPQLTVDEDGRITSVGNVTISSSGGGGSAGLNQVVTTYESTGDGSTVAFNTGTTITSEDLTWVFIDGVYQEKGAYSTSGSTVTFSAAPPNGTSIEILNLSSITTGGAFDHNSFSGDGSTTDFTLANTPDSETDLIVFIDGVYQNNNAFNVSGTTLSFDTAPANGTTVIAYSIGGVVTGKANIVNTFNGDSSTTDFTLSIDPKDEKNTIVFVGGVYQPKATYSISGTTLTFSEAPPTGTGNIEVSISQITTTTQLAADILDGNTFTGSTELTGELTAGEFIGDLRGAILFKAKAGEALSKGNVVYISGISGNTTVVSKADADDAAKMPAFGIMAEDASNNSSATVYTFGTLSDIDTSSFSEGDELFVSTTAGALTNTAPTGESSAIQKMAQVTRSDASAGSIKIMGAGRSNATPNLDDGDIFIGNGSNQAVTSALSTEVESYLDGGTSTPSFASLNVTTTTTDDSVTITTTEDSSAAAPVVTLKRNSSSPADADYLGQIKFKGENDGDQEVVYAKITGKIGDNTDTTEDGIIEFANIKDGSQTITVRLNSDEMQLINSTGLNVGGTSVLSGLTYPTSDGSAGQYLQTDGAGTLSFSTLIATVSDISDLTATATELNYLDGVTGITLGSANELLVVGGDGSSIVSDSTLAVDTSNNRLGINQSSPDVTLHMTGEGAQTAQIRMEQYNDSADAPDLRTRRYRGTISSPSAISSGDYLYRSNHEYWNGSALITGGSFGFDNTNNANRTQFAVSVTTDGTSADINTASKTQLKIDGNDSGAITFNNAYKFPTSDGSANQVLTTDGSGALSFSTVSAPTFKTFGTSSIMIGDTTTGTINAANYNVGLGVDVFAALTEGDYNTAVGFGAGTALTTGEQNVIMGSLAGDALTDADFNVAVGIAALGADTLGSRSTAIGHGALENQNFTSATDTYNTAVGYVAGLSITTGRYNTLIGGLSGDATTTGSFNTTLGYNTLGVNTTGDANVAIGYSALAANTTANNNVAIGNGSMGANTTGTFNVGVGQGSLASNTTASNNTAVGRSALLSNTTGAGNVAVGALALDASTTAENTTAVGYSALTATTTGINNTGMGAFTLGQNTTGVNNVAVGYASLNANTTGSNNVVVGYNALDANTTASNNTALGYFALSANTTGYRNTAVGSNALDAITTGIQNTAVGQDAGGSGTTAVNINAFGYGTCGSVTTGSNNTGFGTEVLASVTTGSNNVAMGTESLLVNTASNNTGIGHSALRLNTTGENNTAFGSQALTANTTSTANVAVGHAAGYSNTTGSRNVWVGKSAGVNATTGVDNTLIGYLAGGDITTGNYNTAIGTQALDAMSTTNSNTAVGYSAGGSVTTGSLNTFIGTLAGDNTTTGVGNLAIGYAMRTSATGSVRAHIGYNNGDTGTADYAITFGRSGTDWSRLSFGASSFTTGSDERKKKDITDHPLGLDFIKQLRTVNYHFKAPCDVPEEWDTYKASETEAKITTWQTGMLAQEVKAALDNLGVDAEKFNGWGQEPDGMQTLDYGQFVMPLIKALQEADDKIDALTTRITALEG